MIIGQWFGGRASVKRLEVPSNPAQRTETLARIMTPGGELAVLADGVTPIMHLGYVELKAGMVRGNHYHQKRHERLYLIAGETLVFLKDIPSGETAKLTLQAGDMAIIGPNVAHAFQPRTAGHALEFAPEPFDAQDVFRVEPLQNA